jgi:hypothetical protein
MKLINRYKIKEIVEIKKYQFDNFLINVEKDLFSERIKIGIEDLEFPELNIQVFDDKLLIKINDLILSKHNQIDEFIKELDNVKRLEYELNNNKKELLEF